MSFTDRLLVQHMNEKVKRLNERLVKNSQNNFRDTERVQHSQQVNSLLSLFNNYLSICVKFKLVIKYCA